MKVNSTAVRWTVLAILMANAIAYIERVDYFAEESDDLEHAFAAGGEKIVASDSRAIVTTCDADSLFGSDCIVNDSNDIDKTSDSDLVSIELQLANNLRLSLDQGG